MPRCFYDLAEMLYTKYKTQFEWKKINGVLAGNLRKIIKKFD